MAEYIDKQVFENIRIPIGHYIRSDHNTAYQQGCEDMLALVQSITPATDVRENVKGKWELKSTRDGYAHGGYYHCSQCGARYEWGGNFCPNCGADMRKTCDRDSCPI